MLDEEPVFGIERRFAAGMVDGSLVVEFVDNKGMLLKIVFK